MYDRRIFFPLQAEIVFAEALQLFRGRNQDIFRNPVFLSVIGHLLFHSQGFCDSDRVASAQGMLGMLFNPTDALIIEAFHFMSWQHFVRCLQNMMGLRQNHIR